MSTGDNEGAAVILQLLDGGGIAFHLGFVDGIGVAHNTDFNALQLGFIKHIVPEDPNAQCRQGIDGVLPTVGAEVPGMVVGNVAYIHVAQLENLAKLGFCA